MEDPYKPPSSIVKESQNKKMGRLLRFQFWLKSDDLEKIPGKGWKIYFWFIVVSTIVGYPLMMMESPFSRIDHLDIVIFLVSTLGFYGFVYRKRTIKQRFWQNWLIFTVLWDVMYVFVFSNIQGLTSVDEFSLLGAALGFVIVLPIYLGLYKYGYLNNYMWKD